MAQISSSTGISLQEGGGQEALQVHEWRRVLDFEGGWCGCVFLQLGDSKELKRLQDCAHGKGVTVFGHSASLLVESKHANVGLYE